MWWPVIGGLAIGLGGMIFPQALGVGYDTIGALLQGLVTTKVIFGVLIVKWFIWAVSLGSGTSGGVLAPLLMMGGALGGLEAMFLPNEGAGFWALISMGATLGGTMRAQYHLRQMAVFLDMPVVNKPEVFVRQAADMFDRELKLQDESTRKVVIDLLASLERLVRRYGK